MGHIAAACAGVYLLPRINVPSGSLGADAPLETLVIGVKFLICSSRCIVSLGMDTLTNWLIKSWSMESTLVTFIEEFFLN